MGMVSKSNILKTQKGFTIVEMLLVIVILGLLATIALPNVASIVLEHKLKKTANEILADLRMAQQLAISQESEYKVFFANYLASLPNIYLIRDLVSNELLKEVQLPSGIDIHQTKTIFFYANGTCENNTITLRSKDRKYLYIKIYRTGRMRITEEPS